MHKSDSAPPSLPPRPGVRHLPTPMEEPEEIYDDCDERDKTPPPNDDCDDVDSTSPPPLPPHPQATYDDIGEQYPPPPPQKPKPGIPLMSAPQDMYDDCGPIVQQLPKRPQPPPPAPTQAAKLPPPPPQESVYELGDDGVDDDGDSVQSHSSLPPPPHMEDEMNSIYEMEPEINHAPARSVAPPAPSLPPRTTNHPPPPTPDHVPPHPPRSSAPAAKPVTSPKGLEASQGFSMNLGLLQNARAGLRRVSQDGTPEASLQDTSHDPKIYMACPDNVYDTKKMFEQKSGGKPGFLRKNSFDKAPQQEVKPVVRFEPKQPEPELPEEIYDDASSMAIDPLMSYNWYHGIISRSDGDQRVRKVAKDGAFLVRVSEKDPQFPYTLVVLHKGLVNNLRIRLRSDKKVALGDEKTGELAFKDVPAMIDHHRQYNVVLLGNNQSNVKLQHATPKS